MHQSKLKSAGVSQMHAPIQRSISPSRSLTCISPVPPGHSTSSNVDPASFSASCSRGDKKCSLCQPTLSFCDMVRYGAMLKKRDIAKWRWRRGWCYVNVGGCYIGSRKNRRRTNQENHAMPRVETHGIVKQGSLVRGLQGARVVYFSTSVIVCRNRFYPTTKTKG